MLTHLFFELFPKKKKNDLPAKNLRKLVVAFDTLQDPTLQFKRSSVKRGSKAMIALSMSHGEEVDWSKVSSSLALGPAEMKGFFGEAKKYSQKLVKLILPELTPSIDAPFSCAPLVKDPAPTEVT
jgi:hypothetical protein